MLLALGAAAPAQAGNVRNSSRTNVNVNRHVDRHGGCCYHDRHHPIATAAAVAHGRRRGLDRLLDPAELLGYAKLQFGAPAPENG